MRRRANRGRLVPERNSPATKALVKRSFATFLSKAQLNLSQQENSLVGADLASVATNFAQAQVANQATLNATAKVLSLPNLLDFIK